MRRMQRQSMRKKNGFREVKARSSDTGSPVGASPQYKAHQQASSRPMIEAIECNDYVPMTNGFHSEATHVREKSDFRTFDKLNYIPGNSFTTMSWYQLS